MFSDPEMDSEIKGGKDEKGHQYCNGYDNFSL